ncbi:hypothetical protein H0H81_007217 [Sphagnurus paluster]|uniref:Peptidase M1 leukotriene A4 hydrolase/aminopeptidase C-terminal domain-containing protein n=1 Tax=Sphagnurus paluster TaxID=117069 RepID=A0A9P7KLR2_9AGAR|nr:hypothetical protein H0H81_007217 [Sphagnurus paluster]
MADPNTQSNYLQIATEHLALEWTLNFDSQLISGSATHHLLVKKDDVNEVVFDTADLELIDAIIAGKSVKFEVKPKHHVMGSALHVTLPSGLKLGQYIDVTIEYKTTKDCAALQWLDKAQTQGKKFPFLFSQCQPIYARAIAPVQDSPSVKIKYTAKVTSVLPVLLSAIRQSPPSEGPAHDGKVIGKDPVTYSYDQPIPIPSYLLAIAAGNVRYRGFPQFEDKKWATGIWAEPELIDKAYEEFYEDTPKFLAAEEKIVTSYRFSVYDLLVDVVVHELTHSWFGNGVTHANASHFWLNEGWTTYIERVLQQELHTPAHRGFSFIIGSTALKNALQQFQDTGKTKYQRLVIDLSPEEDPDKAYSSVPYEKGANFILHIERTLGGLDVFLPYVKDYVETFIGKSITTQQWKDHLYGYWTKHGGPDKVKALDSIDWNAWFNGEGLKLPVELDYDLTLAQEAYALAARWDAARATAEITQLNFTPEDLKDFTANQIIVFLERLQSYQPLPLTHIRYLGSLYKFENTANAEIRFRFYELALNGTDTANAFAQEALDWIVGAGTGMVIGRMKFCRPVFQKVRKVDKPLAVKVWQENKEGFHPVARKLIDEDLGITK